MKIWSSALQATIPSLLFQQYFVQPTLQRNKYRDDQCCIIWVAWGGICFYVLERRYFTRQVTICILRCRNLTPWPYALASQSNYFPRRAELIQQEYIATLLSLLNTTSKVSCHPVSFLFLTFPISLHIVTSLGMWLYKGFGLVTRFINHFNTWLLTNLYSSLLQTH
jgi:hypothetical protein